MGLHINSSNLTGVMFKCSTTGDNLDWNSVVKFTLYKPGPHHPADPIIIAYGEYKGGDANPINFNVPILQGATKEHIDDLVAKMEIAPFGDDKWQCSVIIEFKFADFTSYTFNFGDTKLGNHDGWGHFKEKGVHIDITN